MMFGHADRVSNLGLPVTFQSWRLLSLLRVFLRKRAGLLKDFDHRLPRVRAAHVNLQRAIPRKKTLGGLCSTYVKVQGSFPVHVRISPLAVLVGQDLCTNGLATPAAQNMQLARVSLPRTDYSDDVDVCDGQYLVDGDSHSDVPPDEEQCSFEGLHDLVPTGELQSLLASLPRAFTRLYLPMRRVARRFRSAKGKFGPRRCFNGVRFKRRFVRKDFGARPGGKSRNGFHCDGMFVSFGHALGEQISAFFG